MTGARIALLALVLTATAAASTARAGTFTRPYYPQAAYDLDHDFPVVELVTMGIGSLIWERHGHLALCVIYEDPRQDACYNYGVGDFHDPVAMGWGFLRGNHSFWVDKEAPNRMLAIYRYADRSIWVQPLPLTQPQKQEVIAKLEHDILDDNKYYAYDHFADNCTTRIRDVIDHATGGKLAAMSEPMDGETFRDYARLGFLGMRMPLLITDLAMGRSTDRAPTFWELMFLPQYLREAVAKLWNVQPIAIYERRECVGATGPAAAQCTQRGIPDPESQPSGRVLLALLIIAITSPVWLTRLWGRFTRTGIAIAIIPPVLFGLVFWMLAIISPLPYMRWNETCLVLFPLDLLLLVLPAGKRETYARGRVVMLVLMALLMIVHVLKQPLWAALLWPLIPAAVVGFWPPRDVAATTGDASVTTDDTAAPVDEKKKRFGKRRAP